MNESLKKDIIQFRDERNWQQFHNPKDLAISISLEAAELLEIFQWSGAETDVKEKHDRMREELADVMIYGVLMADSLDFNLDEIMAEKLKRNKEKYPVEKAYGSNKKYSEFIEE